MRKIIRVGMNLVRWLRELSGYDNPNQYAKALGIHSETIYRLETRTTAKQIKLRDLSRMVNHLAERTGKKPSTCWSMVGSEIDREFGE